MGDAVLISTEVLGGAHRVTTALQDKLDAIDQAVAETPEKAEEALARRQNKLGRKSRVVSHLALAASASRRQSAPAALLLAAEGADGDGAPTGEAKRSRRKTMLRGGGGAKGQPGQQPSPSSLSPSQQPPLQSFQQLAAQQQLAAAPAGLDRLRAAGSVATLRSSRPTRADGEPSLTRTNTSPGSVHGGGASSRRRSTAVKQAFSRTPKPTTAGAPVESRPPASHGWHGQRSLPARRATEARACSEVP